LQIHAVYLAVVLQKLQYRGAVGVVSGSGLLFYSSCTGQHDAKDSDMHRSLDYSVADLNRLHDQAHEDAQALRSQAIDDFWRGADGLLDTATQRVARAARRARQALLRHRAAPAATRGCAHAGC
jgi:hypothetical protein